MRFLLRIADKLAKIWKRLVGPEYLLDKHLNSTNGNVVVFADQTVLGSHERTIRKRKNTLLVLSDEDLKQSIAGFEPELVICIGADSRATHELYMRANFIKKRGVPVVFGNMERNLFYEPPSLDSIDLGMNGAFFLVSKYITGTGKKGDYVEFGVFDGRSFTLAFHSLKKVCRKFHAFDSFAGIVGAADVETNLYPDGSYFANVETFRHNMKLAGVNMSRVNVVKGAFQDTLAEPFKKHGIQTISVCHIDSDISEAAYLALNFVLPKLQNGAIILFDEYHAFAADPDRGERHAVSRWLSENPDISLEKYRDYTAVGRAYIFRRSSQTI